MWFYKFHNNGKTFNWAGLPTELKERVVDFCIDEPSYNPDFFHGITMRQIRSANHSNNNEVIQKLGEWKGLLVVDTQTRAITLRLLFKGSRRFHQGFCMTSYSGHNFSRRIGYLEKHFQIVKSGGMPVRTLPNGFTAMDPVAAYKAYQYSIAPKLYPEFDRFATFKHDIQKVCLSFDFPDLLHFFKVKVANFDILRPPYLLDCEVFRQMPCLKEIVIRLPQKERWFSEGRWHSDHGIPPVPSLWGNSPCMRKILDILFEAMGTEMAYFKNFRVRDFFIEDDKVRYNAMREAGIASRKFSDEDLEELYKDCGGGVQLGRTVSSHLTIVGKQPRRDFWVDYNQVLQAGVFPTECKCQTPCRKTYGF